MNKKIVALIFCIIIFFGLFNIFSQFFYIDSKISFLEYLKGELTFSEEIDEYLKDLYDKVQIALNKKEIGNFTYYRNTENNGLIRISKEINEKEVLNRAKKINKLNKIFKEKGINYIYINIPNEVKDREKFKNIDYGNEQSDLLLENLQSTVHFLDLRKYNEIFELEGNYYKTDHHMNMETTFEAYKIIANEIQTKYNIDVSDEYLDINNYRKVEFHNSFLGSKGVNVSENYIEKEDFMALLPKYDTDFEYKRYNTNGEMIIDKKGNFEQVFIDNKILYNDNYINKYNAFLYGDRYKAEDIIINYKAENDKKLLVISNSFGRSLVPYISQNFYETRYIDPQENRFEGDVLKYIEDYNPDMIIMLYDSTNFSSFKYIRLTK